MIKGIAAVLALWYRFATPTGALPAKLIARERYRKARLLSIVHLATLLLSLIIFFEWVFLHSLTGLLVVIGVSTITLASLWSNKRGHLLTAAMIFVSGYVLIISAGLFPLDLKSTDQFLWEWPQLALPSVVVALFLPYWVALLFAGIDAAILLTLFFMQYHLGTITRLIDMAGVTDFVINVVIILVMLAVSGALYAHSLNNAIVLADRSDEIMSINNELETVFDTVKDALIVLDTHYTVMRANQKCKKILGSIDFSGLKLDDLIQLLHATLPDGAVMRPDMFFQPAPSQTLTEGTLRLSLHLPDKRLVFVEANGAYLLNEHDEKTGMLIAIRDITQDYHNERNLSLLREVARVSSQASSEASVAEAVLNVLLEAYTLPHGLIVVRNDSHPQLAHVLTLQSSANTTACPEVTQRLRERVEREPINSESALAILRVMATGEALFAAPTHPASNTPQSNAIEASFTASIPLHHEGHVFGAIGLAWTEASSTNLEPPTPDFLSLVAQEIATALHRAQLFEAACRLAQCDPLTGLLNHRTLLDQMKQELIRCGAQGIPVSVIMLDIDHFRRFNEKYGHAAGDRALRSVAHAITTALDEDEKAGRYGGEEFTIILPGADHERANVVAEAIRAQVEAVQVLADDGNSAMTITVSQGFATFPLHASAPPSLLKAADLALYASKRSGRNNVTPYSADLLTSAKRENGAGMRGFTQDPLEFSIPSGADLETIQAFIAAIDLRDGYTAAHSDGVSQYAVTLGHALKLPLEQIETLRLGGLIHDVGKIGVPDQILRKPGKLTEAEWELMRKHTTMGETILNPIEQFQHLLPLVRWHHERLDGSGYPDGLRGKEIPYLVRILSIADVFEAYTADRPYHPGRSLTEGMHFLQREADAGRLDNAMVALFQRTLIKYQQQTSSWFKQEAA